MGIFMVKAKAGFTVEAALVCPFLCLIICGMLLFTLHLYQEVDTIAAWAEQGQEKGAEAIYLIRLETVMEDDF